MTQYVWDKGGHKYDSGNREYDVLHAIDNDIIWSMDFHSYNYGDCEAGKTDHPP